MRFRFGVICCVWSAVTALLVHSVVAAPDIELFVSPSGHDEAAGTAAAPLATIAAAQTKLRELRNQQTSDASAHIWIAEGIYELAQPLEFTEEDNGPAGAATVYEALPGQQVILRGGITLPSDHWQAVTGAGNVPEVARPHLRVFDLTELNVERVDGHHPRRARHSFTHPVPLELFCGPTRLPVAGWPNHGWARMENVDNQNLSWQVAGLHKFIPATGARAHGFWQYDWQDSCEAITLEPKLNQSTTVAIRPEHKEHVKAIRTGARYRLENLPSELDAPGEWYHDSQHHLLYAWLPQTFAPSDLFVSTHDTTLSIYDGENLTLRGLVIEGARACCVEIAGGQGVSLEYCQLRHAGNLGVNIYHGQNHRVSHCEVTSTGAGGVRVEGGHRESLVACDHVIEHNRLHDYAQLHLAYRPAINVYGVGVTVRHNAIFEGPHAAIILHGNEHRVEHNDIHHVCTQTDDVGAIYLSHNPTYRGNVIAHNYLHDLGGYSPTGVMGIYLDDFASGTTVSHNVLERAGRGVAIGGGRDNVVLNNVFIDCLAAVQIDCRGTTWAKRFVNGNPSRLSRYLDEIGDHAQLYAQRYPELATLLTDSPELAKGNRIERNVFEAPIGVDLQDGLTNQIVHVQNNFGGASTLLVKEGQRWTSQPGSHLAEAGFEAIELNQVGPVTPALYVSQPD